MRALRSDQKLIVILFILVFVATYFTVYTVIAYKIAGHITESPPKIFWNSAPGGSFFPWPNEPGMLEMLSEMNVVDSFIYVYLIKSWVLVGVVIVLWIGSILQALIIIRLMFNIRKFVSRKS